MMGCLRKVVNRFHCSIFSMRKVLADCVAVIEPKPILVLGNQKSGTTAVAALVAEATGQSVILDVFFRKRGSIRRILAGDLSLRRFREKNKSYFTQRIIKDPDFTFLASDLFELYPEAPIVFILRDPVDNVRSILNRLKISGQVERLSECDRAELERISPEWFDVVDGQRYGLYDSNPVIALLRRAIESHKICEKLSRNLGERIVVVRYEDFLQDKTQYIHQLAERLNLKVSSDISSKMDVQFQPRGDSSVDFASFFGADNWPRIRDELSRPECRQVLHANGYSEVS